MIWYPVRLLLFFPSTLYAVPDIAHMLPNFVFTYVIPSAWILFCSLNFFHVCNSTNASRLRSKNIFFKETSLDHQAKGSS